MGIQSLFSFLFVLFWVILEKGRREAWLPGDQENNKALHPCASPLQVSAA